MAKPTVCVSALLLLLLLGMLSEGGLSQSAVPCCTRYSKTPMPVKLLTACTPQTDLGACNIKAIIFRTVKNRLVCADPEKRWVKKAMKSLSCETL
ncbi:C-C motif chemokine 20 [Salarias fasciatus]|uniref:C-C motif chemokine 20 n=1 Tax=Salarias fasciatus TaxID=181472 RepID=UPI00117704A4|nr:C-C motif chemokine 20-like [Salarias fasciatus]